MDIKSATEKLWRSCFDDSDEFVRLYFDRCYSDDVNCYTLEGDELVAALQLLRYGFSFRGATLPLSYVSGACTRRDCRGRGVMGDLLRRSLRSSFERGDFFCSLIPANAHLFEYYAKFGFFTAFHEAYAEWQSCEPDEMLEVLPADVGLVGRLYPLFAEWMGRRDLCVQHDAGDFGVILADFLLEGEAYVAWRNGKPCGVLFAERRGDALLVRDCLAADETARLSLLCHARLCADCGVRLLLPRYDEKGDGVRLGMLRLLRVEEFLAHYAKAEPRLSLALRVSDDVIEQNNGCFIVSDGECRRVDAAAVRDTRVVDVAALGEMLLSALPNRMTLMLN